MRSMPQCAATCVWAVVAALAFPLGAQTTQPAAVVLPASLEAFEAADQYAKVSGYVEKVNADIGDHVKQGQVLAEIDAPELMQDVVEANAVLQARRQMLKASEAGMLQAQKMHEVAKSQLGSANVERDLAAVTLKRQQELFAGKAITDQQLDDVKAKAATTAASAAVAEARIAAAEADVVAAGANRAVAAAQVEVAAAQVQKAQALFNYTRIVAPFDGVITRRVVNRGDLVPAAMANRAAPLFTCQRVETIRIFCDVPEASAAGIHAGSPAEIKLYAPGMTPLKATVTRIAGALDVQTRTMRVEIDVPNGDEKLRPGMYAQVTLTPGAVNSH
jgi:multidrug efflux pump subunit AcrA (membrane-fusion protein)